jgi:hypothetical protein
VIKLSMKVGQAELNIEAARSDVEFVLSTFWLPLIERDAKGFIRNEESLDSPRKGKERSVSGQRRRENGSTKEAKSNDENASYENDLANGIKSHELATQLSQEIILAKADWLNKCKMVLLIAGKPAHSGTISRVLTKVGVKNSLPTISKTLSNNKGSFITGGTNPETYDFTAISRGEFIAWLKGSDVGAK